MIFRWSFDLAPLLLITLSCSSKLPSYLERDQWSFHSQHDDKRLNGSPSGRQEAGEGGDTGKEERRFACLPRCHLVDREGETSRPNLVESVTMVF